MENSLKKKKKKQIYTKFLVNHPLEMEKIGTLVGSYDKGLVIGNYYFPYENMKSISKSKDEEIMIKGREDSKNYIIKIGSLNSANQTIIELNNALNEGKIDEKKINLKKIKNF